jgi:hypothetical protein
VQVSTTSFTDLKQFASLLDASAATVALGGHRG